MGRPQAECQSQSSSSRIFTGCPLRESLACDTVVVGVVILGVIFSAAMPAKDESVSAAYQSQTINIAWLMLALHGCGMSHTYPAIPAGCFAFLAARLMLARCP